jgi:MEMO1 family protein
MATTYMRHPRVAGSFYPKAPGELTKLLDQCYREAPKSEVPLQRTKAIGAVIPHAGYVYSGGVAAKVFARLEMPTSVIVLCPNHTGMGARLSLWPGGLWMSPVGDLKIDERLGSALLDECPGLEAETLAHMNEHAIEVMIPFLLREKPETRFAAVVVGTHDVQRIAAFGDGLAKAIKKVGYDVTIIASSDMNHYEDHDTTLAKDEIALERVRALDPVGLIGICEQRDISMCGVAPTAAMLRAALALGAQEAIMVDHKTSGDAFGDYARVVGYAGVIVR